MITRAIVAAAVLPLLVPLAAQAQTTVASKPVTWSKTVGHFAAGHTYDVSVTATQASTGNKTYRALNVYEWASVFGVKKDVIRSETKATTDAALAVPTVTRKIYFLGFLRQNDALTTVPLAGTMANLTKQMQVFTATQSFNVGPVPMYVSGDVYADNILRAGGNLDSFGGDMWMRTTAALNLEISVGVGIDGVASFGVSGDTALISSTPYAKTNARWSYARNNCPGAVNEDRLAGSGWLMDDIHALDGKIQLFAEIAWQRWELTIHDYAGYDVTSQVVYDTGAKSWTFAPVGLPFPGYTYPVVSCRSVIPR